MIAGRIRSFTLSRLIAKERGKNVCFDLKQDFEDMEAAEGFPEMRALRQACEVARCFGDPPTLSVKALGPFLQDGGGLLMGEGWSDIYLMIYCEAEPDTLQDAPRSAGEAATARRRRPAKGARRPFDMFAIQHTVFQDHEVHRTEMFLRPTAIPFAAADPERFNVSLAVRAREDREQDGQIQKMLEAARNSIQENTVVNETSDSEWARTKAARDAVSIHRIPGRNDLEFQISSLRNIMGGADSDGDVKQERWQLSPSRALAAIHERVGAGAHGGGGSEEIVTRAGFRHCSGTLGGKTPEENTPGEAS